MNEVIDKELGKILIKRNARAKRVIARRHHNYFQITVPSYMPNKDILKRIEELRTRMLELPEQKIEKIDINTSFTTATFDVALFRISNTNNSIYYNLKDGKLKIKIPDHFDIESNPVQDTLRQIIIDNLRKEAKRVLPPKVEFFANRWNLKVKNIKIGSSKTRWGSCSNKKNINLSLFLMMMPNHLIDYVILHELAHIEELNHSSNFWNLLNIFCESRCNELDKESRNYISPQLKFLKQ